MKKRPAAFQAKAMGFSTLATNELGSLMNEFGTVFLKKVTLTDDNVCFSGISIATVFAMLLSGARGETAVQLKRCLRVDGIVDIDAHFQALTTTLRPHELSEGIYMLNVASKMFVSSHLPISEQFKNTIEANYSAKVETFDFATDSVKGTDLINKWVYWQTKCKFNRALDEALGPETKLVIVNIIYFKAVWQNRFDSRSTRQDVFYGVVDTKVDFMFCECLVRAYRDDAKNITVVKVPYVGNASMVYVVTNDKSGLDSLIASSSCEDFEYMVKTALSAPPVEAFVYMPKFKIQHEYDLIPILSSLGVKDLFDPTKSDLSGINDKRDLYVNMAMHKAVVDVDEDGTEAAVVTGDVTEDESKPKLLPIVYRINRPFVFFIRDHNTGINLFSGAISRI
ncbi:Leukocyte elastase inhibitor [Halotydeus destructor]|nr:Leukocyte elastase inhibitor [Halotydeus destructor]